MKLLSLFLASSSFAQDDASDKWVGYDYGSYGSYGSYDTGMSGKFVNEADDFGASPDGGRAGNGLSCWYCHGRLRMGSQETATNNAWLDCATNGWLMECKGDRRSCMTEERRRYDVTTEVYAKCCNPEACMYLWRRNERFTLGFHNFGDQTETATPVVIDDECRISGSKHLSMRSQWEHTCRHCCKADASGTGCNAPDGAGGPIGDACGGTGCGAANAATLSGRYAIDGIDAFVMAFLHFNRAHPGDGRNSLGEDKFIGRVGSEQADALSTEDTDFHDDRAFANTNGGFITR